MLQLIQSFFIIYSLIRRKEINKKKKINEDKREKEKQQTSGPSLFLIFIAQWNIKTANTCSCAVWMRKNGLAYQHLCFRNFPDMFFKPGISLLHDGVIYLLLLFVYNLLLTISATINPSAPQTTQRRDVYWFRKWHCHPTWHTDSRARMVWLRPPCYII